MKAEDTISSLQRLKGEENGNVWKMVVEKGKEEERNEESALICDYLKHSSIERERRLLDEKRVKWIARRMDMIAEEMKERFQGEMGVEYRVNKQAAGNKPSESTKSPAEIEDLLFREQILMELSLLLEVKGWELLFWIKFNAFLDQIGNDRVEEKERLTMEWRADCWKRLNPMMHAAQKRLEKDKNPFLKPLGNRWALSISQLLEGVEIPNPTWQSKFWEDTDVLFRDAPVSPDDESPLRMEKEIEDIEFRLKRGYELGRFDQFWDDDTLFECRCSRSKWLNLIEYNSSTPLEIYSHALKGNEKIIHIVFSENYYYSDSDSDSDSDVNLFRTFRSAICDLPHVTSISIEHLPAIHRDLLFMKSTDNDLITFANENRLKFDPISTYIFTDAGNSDMYEDKLANNARVLISFIAPTSGESLILRLKHSQAGGEDGLLEVTLGSTIIQLNPPSKSSLTVDDITLYPISSPSTSDHLSFEPGIRNDIVIQFREAGQWYGHLLHDLELLDDAGGLWRG